MYRQKNLLTYILYPITKIYASEQPKAFLAFIAYFLLMTSYYVIRPTRSSLFMKDWGTDFMPVFYLIIAAVVLCASFLYNFLVTQFPRTKFIRIVFGGVLISFLAVWFIKTYPNALPITISEKALTTFWYIWICAYILFLTSLFWSFNHDLHTPEQSRRLYPLILLGAQVGVITGSYITKWFLNSFATWSETILSKRIEINNYDLILVSSFFLILVWCILEILRFFDTPKQDYTAEDKTQTNYKKDNFLTGLGTILTNKYAFCLAIIVIFGTLSLTIFDYQYKRMIERDIISQNVLIQEQDFNNDNQILSELQNMNEDIANVLYSYEPALKNFAQTPTKSPNIDSNILNNDELTDDDIEKIFNDELTDDDIEEIFKNGYDPIEERKQNIKEACQLLNNIIEKGHLYIKIN